MTAAMSKPTIRKVDVVRTKPRMTETVGDDGTLDSDFLSKPRRPDEYFGRKPFVSFSHISEEQWSRIFGRRSVG